MQLGKFHAWHPTLVALAQQADAFDRKNLSDSYEGKASQWHDEALIAAGIAYALQHPTEAQALATRHGVTVDTPAAPEAPYQRWYIETEWTAGKWGKELPSAAPQPSWMHCTAGYGLDGMFDTEANATAFLATLPTDLARATRYDRRATGTYAFRIVQETLEAATRRVGLD